MTELSEIMWPAAGRKLLHADKWTDQPAPETGHTETPLHGHDAQTRLLRTDDRLMINIIISEIKISRTVSTAFVAEAAFEDAGELHAAMGMLEHTCPGA